MEAALRIERAQPRTKGKSKEEEEGKGAEGSSPTPTPNKENRKKGGKKGKSRGGNNANKQPESIQPDPRWASELAQLKEMLAASNN